MIFYYARIKYNYVPSPVTPRILLTSAVPVAARLSTAPRRITWTRTLTAATRGTDGCRRTCHTCCKDYFFAFQEDNSTVFSCSNSFHMFGHFDKSVFLELCRHLETVSVKSGQFLFKVGDPDEFVHVLQVSLIV